MSSIPQTTDNGNSVSDFATKFMKRFHLGKLLTRKQTQELLHMGKNRILDHIQSGRLRALVLDGRYLIKKEDIVDFINRLPYR